MGGIDHTKYFWPGVTLILMAAHPNFKVAKKNLLLCVRVNFFKIFGIWLWVNFKHTIKFWGLNGLCKGSKINFVSENFFERS